MDITVSLGLLPENPYLAEEEAAGPGMPKTGVAQQAGNATFLPAFLAVAALILSGLVVRHLYRAR
jgi:hypothetical protein